MVSKRQLSKVDVEAVINSVMTREAYIMYVEQRDCWDRKLIHILTFDMHFKKVH